MDPRQEVVAMTRWYSVGVAMTGSPDDADDDTVDRLLDALMLRPDVAGPVVLWGGLAGGPGTQLSLQAPGPVEAARKAISAFASACEEAGAAIGEVAYVEVMTEEYQELANA